MSAFCTSCAMRVPRHGDDADAVDVFQRVDARAILRIGSGRTDVGAVVDGRQIVAATAERAGHAVVGRAVPPREPQPGRTGDIHTGVVFGQVGNTDHLRRSSLLRFARSTVESADDLGGVAGVAGIDAQTGESLAFDDLAGLVEAFDDQIEFHRRGVVILEQGHADPAGQFDLVGRQIDANHALAQNVGRSASRSASRMLPALRPKMAPSSTTASPAPAPAATPDAGRGLEDAGLRDAHAQGGEHQSPDAGRGRAAAEPA